MSDLRKIFESRDFVVNSNIIKSISNIDITLDEFYLIIYYINIYFYFYIIVIKYKIVFDN